MYSRNCETRKALPATLVTGYMASNILLMERIGERTEGTTVGNTLAKIFIGRRKAYVIYVNVA